MKGSTKSPCTCKVQVDPAILSMKSHWFIYIYWSGGIGIVKKQKNKGIVCDRIAEINCSVSCSLGY